MSDDEMEQETTRTFRVLTPVWRSTELTDFLHVIDSIYFAMRLRDGSKQRGSWPRNRLYDAENIRYTQRTTLVRNLPRNAYSSTYLAKFQNPELSISPGSPYPFNHAPRVFQCVTP